MTEHTMQPTGVVLDEPLAHALLYEAVHEGLVDSDPGIGNGFIKRVLGTPPSELTLNDAYEQLVLGGRLYVPTWLPTNWSGELFERGILKRYEQDTDVELIDIPEMPSSLLLGMLASRKINWSESMLTSTISGFRDAYNHWDALKDGKSFDAVEVFRALEHITGRDPFDGYTPEQQQAWQSLDREYRKVKPAYQCIEAYRKVLSASLSLSALSSLPIGQKISSSQRLIDLDEGRDQCTLLRITTSKFRRVPIGATLRETLEIAKSPEADALRVRLSKWTQKLRSGEVEPAALILKDVEDARKSLETAKSIGKIGEYTTFVGIPVAIGGAFVAGPAVTAVGIGVAVVGGVALGGQKLVERMNRWAMFARS